MDWLGIKGPSSCISSTRETLCFHWRDLVICGRGGDSGLSCLSIVVYPHPQPSDNCFYCWDQLPIIPPSKKSFCTIFYNGKSSAWQTWYWWWWQTPYKADTSPRATLTSPSVQYSDVTLERKWIGAKLGFNIKEMRCVLIIIQTYYVYSKLTITIIAFNFQPCCVLRSQNSWNSLQNQLNK